MRIGAGGIIITTSTDSSTVGISKISSNDVMNGFAVTRR